MIQVTMLDTVELATYSVRTFALYKVQRCLFPLQLTTRVRSQRTRSRQAAALLPLSRSDFKRGSRIFLLTDKRCLVFSQWDFPPLTTAGKIEICILPGFYALWFLLQTFHHHLLIM